MGDELELSLAVSNSQIHIGRQSKVSLRDRMMADTNTRELFLEFQPNNGSNSFHGLMATKSPQNNKSTPYFLEKNVNMNNFGGALAGTGEDESKSVFTRSDNGYQGNSQVLHISKQEEINRIIRNYKRKISFGTLPTFDP